MKLGQWWGRRSQRGGRISTKERDWMVPESLGWGLEMRILPPPRAAENKLVDMRKIG